MDINQLSAQLQALGVVLPDEGWAYRAALYVDRLQAARTYFTQTLLNPGPNSLGAAGPFAAQALNDPKLLETLAAVLDRFVGGAVSADWWLPANRNLTFLQYFDLKILDADPQTFAQKLQQFGQRYPILDYALQKAFDNFTRNIAQACTRAHGDRADLVTFYQDLYQANFAINALTRIESSGSDFHKGGQQVLFLTFAVSHVVSGNVQQERLKVVYKPSDLEADCLLVGQSVPVNRVTNNFMAASLFEIYNVEVAAMKAANPAYTGQALPTYRILPRNFMSAQGQFNAQSLRNAYGYLQYLDQGLSGTDWQFFGLFPFASSDFVVFLSEQATTDLISDFHRQEGAVAALACSFSLVDLHMENLRVIQRRPTVIDLEICLTEGVAQIGETLLLAPSGGLNGLTLEGPTQWLVQPPLDQARVRDMDLSGDRDYKSNRLWEVAGMGGRLPVRLDPLEILRGFRDAMLALRSLVQQGQGQPLDTWFTRLDNVVVRVLPIKTQTLQAVQNYLYVSSYADHAITPRQQLRDSLIRETLTNAYFEFSGVNDPAALPRFVVLAPGVSDADFDNLDIPIFYHRIGANSVGIVNSSAVAVPIPQNVTIIGNGGQAQQKPVASDPQVFNRATYFAAAPTANVVRLNQVTPLGQPQQTFNQRRDALARTIRDYFQNHAEGPQKIVPIDRRAEA